MGFFSKKQRSSVALIDINSSSVAGGLVHIQTGAQPTIYYTNRLDIEKREGEELADAMLRTLETLTVDLVKTGAPLMHQAVGTGHIGHILASVGAPWQATKVRAEHISALKPFTFTRALLTETTQKDAEIPAGFIKSGESVIATLLNGYEMAHPFGKKVTRAELIILSSLLQKSIADKIETLLRKTYHTHALTMTAFAPVAYTVFRDSYPHEKDFLVLDVSGEATDIAFIKQGLLVDVASVEHGINELMRKAQSAAKTHELSPFGAQIEEAQKQWLEVLSKTLQNFSTTHALPRTLFLLADEESRDYLRNLLDSPALRSLWLTDEPLTIIPVVPSHFAAYVKSRGEAEGDVYLALLALFANKTQS